jgi:zinc protease
MILSLRALRLSAPLCLLATLCFVPAGPLAAQQAEKSATLVPARVAPAPQHLQPDDPWIYRGTDIPVDPQWLFGELPNGLRYAVRGNAVPPDQVSIRVRIDAGSLHETESERGFAHLIEHLVFRESSVMGNGEAIQHFQRLGAGFGSDTNAQTSPTQTVYQLDLPNAADATLEDTVRRLAGMIREPKLSADNLAADLPIVLAERRERSGPEQRIAEATRETFFAGQLLAARSPIGTVEALQGATPASVQAFHKRWYRPDKAVVVMVGDADPRRLAELVERYFSDWQASGDPAQDPAFGDPKAPAGADAANPVGDVRVLAEPGQPRAMTYAIMRPWREVTDNLEYNRGLLIGSIAEGILNRRLETRARAGGSYLYAAVQRDKTSRSSDATYVAFAPLDSDWKAALADVRAVIADAVAEPPSQEEIDRELAEYDVAFANSVEQSRIQAGAQLADSIVGALDIREAVASPETVLDLFRTMRARFTPAAIHETTRELFQGEVIRALLLTPEVGEATEADLRAALLAPVVAVDDARTSGEAISFADLPPVGVAAEPTVREPLGVTGSERLTFGNGVRAILFPTDNEPGRTTVRVRFGGGREAFADDEAVYAQLGQMALVSSGLGPLGQEELDRIATGRKLAFDFNILDHTFVFEGQTRAEDVTDQLYLFAAKLAMPRWEPAPFLRAKASALLTYDSSAGNPGGVLGRDLQWLLHGRDPRYAAPTPEQLRAATPTQFREVWERMLKQGPIEVAVFGEFDRDLVVAALSRTFGALPPREAFALAVGQQPERLPVTGAEAVVLNHKGEADQAAAVIAWPTGGGSDRLPESRKLEVLAQLFSNRLLDTMRERSGASYAPYVGSDWPLEVPNGGQIVALAQLPPDQVPVFFDVAEEIARELATTPPAAEELTRVTEPLLQLLNRAMTGHTFWLNLLQGSSFDNNRVAQLPTLMDDYTRVTPEEIRALAARYFGARSGWRLAVLPETGRATAVPASVPASATTAAPAGAAAGR